MGPQWDNALKTACPNLEGVVRSFIVMVQRGRGMLVDILLIGWWGGKWEVGDIINLLVPTGSRVYVLVGSIPLISPTWCRFRYLQNCSKILLCVSLRGNPDSAPRLHYCFLTAPPLSPHPLPSLISIYVNWPFGTQRRSWRLKETYFL